MLTLFHWTYLFWQFCTHYCETQETVNASNLSGIFLYCKLLAICGLLARSLSRYSRCSQFLNFDSNKASITVRFNKVNPALEIGICQFTVTIIPLNIHWIYLVISYNSLIMFCYLFCDYLLWYSVLIPSGWLFHRLGSVSPWGTFASSSSVVVGGLPCFSLMELMVVIGYI